MTSTAETLARHRKATRLVEQFAAAGATVEQLKNLSQDGWAIAAESAKVRVPSDTTKALVIQLLAERTKATTDPFARFAPERYGPNAAKPATEQPRLQPKPNHLVGKDFRYFDTTIRVQHVELGRSDWLVFTINDRRQRSEMALELFNTLIANGGIMPLEPSNA